MSHFFANKQNFYINSRNRTSGTDSNFSIVLDINANTEYTHICLLSASIPKTYYAVQNLYNVFTLVEGLTSRNITITPGNYSRNCFAISLKNLLNTGAPSGWVYDITYENISRSVDTGKYTYSVSGNNGVQPIFIVPTGIYEALGFDINSTNIFIGDVVVSKNVCNLNPESTLIIHCSNVDGHNSHLKSLMTTTTDSYDYIIYNEGNIDASSKRLSVSKSNVFNFTLTTEDDILIDLNGLNFVFTIVLFTYSQAINEVTEL